MDDGRGYCGADVGVMMMSWDCLCAFVRFFVCNIVHICSLSFFCFLVFMCMLRAKKRCDGGEGHVLML